MVIRTLVVKLLEPWARNHQQRWHAEALQMYGEKVIIRHRWNIKDYAEGRVIRCTSCGAGVRLNERQRIRVLSASSGTFTLAFAGQTTVPIPFDASATEVRTALENLEVNEIGDVVVTGDDIQTRGLIVEFLGQWAYNESIPDLTYDVTGLGGGTLEVFEIQPGSGGQNVQARFAAVYKQSGDSRCPDCYGVGFEGGYEPLIYVTFAMIQDQVQETTHAPAGAMQREEPNAQFSFEPAVEEFDLVARIKSWEGDGVTPKEARGRFILGEVQPVTLRTGPGSPSDSIALHPSNLRTQPEPRNHDWIIGQKAQIHSVPREHPENFVPLTRFEERLVAEGITLRRHWYDRVEVDTPIVTGEEHP